MRLSRAAWILTLLLAAPRACGAAIPAAVTSGAWCEVRSPHVRVLSDAGIERADHVAERIERLHEQLEHMTPALARPASQPDVVFLFRSPETFRAYLPLYQGRPEEDSGLYQPAPNGGYLMLVDGPDVLLDRVALHEGTHAMLHAAITRVPLWLDEGLAQYLSTLRVDDADARVGEPMPEMVQWLRMHDRMPIDALLAMDATAPDYHTGERRQTFYAESWLLVHLLLTGQYGDDARFDHYLDALAHGGAAAHAFRDAFGEPQHLQWQLESELSRPKLGTMDWTFPLAYSRMSIQRRESVTSASVLAALGGMLRWRPDGGMAAATEHARAALMLDAGDAEALALSQSLHDAYAGGAPGGATPGGASDGLSEFDREQQAIGAYNTGVAAYNRGDLATARTQFRIAAALAKRPDLVASIATGADAVRHTGPYAKLDELQALLMTDRRADARRLVAQLLADDVDATLRRSLKRLAAALDAR